MGPAETYFGCVVEFLFDWVKWRLVHPLQGTYDVSEGQDVSLVPIFEW